MTVIKSTKNGRCVVEEGRKLKLEELGPISLESHRELQELNRAMRAHERALRDTETQVSGTHESQPSKIPTAYRTCPLCKEVYAEAIAGLWRKIILDGKQVSVCAGCERKLTRLVEG